MGQRTELDNAIDSLADTDLDWFDQEFGGGSYSAVLYTCVLLAKLNRGELTQSQTLDLIHGIRGLPEILIANYLD